jgi:hypothetical protein
MADHDAGDPRRDDPHTIRYVGLFCVCVWTVGLPPSIVERLHEDTCRAALCTYTYILLTLTHGHVPLYTCTYCNRFDQPIPVDEAELPLKLPDMDDFAPGNDPQGT